MENINEIISLLKEGGTVQVIEDNVKTLQDNGDYVFNKSDILNSEVSQELNDYFSGDNDLIYTHDLIYDQDSQKYYYKKKVEKKQVGGQLTFTPAFSTSSSSIVSKLNDKIKLWMEDLFPDYKEITGETIEQESQKSDKLTSPITPTQEQQAQASKTPTVNTPIPTNLNLNGWDLNKTLQHLRSHAHEKSTHWCAKYVRQALEAGGLVGFRVPNAKDEVKLKTLESIGFSRIAEANDNDVTKGYIPQAGDIAITYENGNHASMYDGTRWISDFRQNGIDVYGKLKNSKAIIYRRLSKDGSGTSISSGFTADNFQANQDIVSKAVSASKLGYFMDPHWTTKTQLGRNNYKSRCTSGPATFYHAAGVELNGYWWKDKNGNAVTYKQNPVGTNLDKAGFVKVWEGTADDARNNRIPHQPGDIKLDYGTTPNHVHAQMWNGENYVSDTVQDKAWVFGNENGRVELWRYRGKGGTTTTAQDNVLLINKTERTLTVNGQVFKIGISKNGLDNTRRSGDGLTPEGEFSLGDREYKGGYNDPVYGYRPNAYGGRFYRLSGGIAQGRGFGIHGSDEYNNPDRYEVGKIGTHGCISLKNSDLDKLEQIFANGGGASNFKVKIVKS